MRILKKYSIYIVIGIIFLFILISCDNLTCSPDIKDKGKYIGFMCGGKF